MPKVIADPEHLRDFAAKLDHAVAEVRSRKTGISSSLNDLHHIWRDKKYSDFERVFKDTMTRLDSFFNRSEEFSKELKRQATHLRNYLE